MRAYWFKNNNNNNNILTFDLNVDDIIDVAIDVAHGDGVADPIHIVACDDATLLLSWSNARDVDDVVIVDVVVANDDVVVALAHGVTCDDPSLPLMLLLVLMQL